MKKCILIVGQKVSSVTNYLEAHGYDYITLKDVKRTKFADKKFKRRVLCDFSTRESTLEAVHSIKGSIDGVLATYESYVLPAAWIAESLGLPGISVESAEACTDKSIMRGLFALAPEKISPDYLTVTSEADVIQFADGHQFPLILKPANLSKSLLVTKNHSLAELIENYKKTSSVIDGVYRKYAPDRTPKLIIEEFMEGSIHSVDAFIDRSGTPHVLKHVVDYQTGYDIGFDDNFHYSRIIPSKLPETDQAAIRHCAEVGTRSLGMKSSPAHIEIILTKDGPRIVEIGARNGGYRERMHMLANDLDILGASLSLALDDTLNIESSRNDNCAVLELFPKSTGKFAGIKNLKKLEQLESLRTRSIKNSLGEKVGKASDGFKSPLIMTLFNTDPEAFESDLNTIRNEVEVLIR